MDRPGRTTDTSKQTHGLSRDKNFELLFASKSKRTGGTPRCSLAAIEFQRGINHRVRHPARVACTRDHCSPRYLPDDIRFDTEDLDRPHKSGELASGILTLRATRRASGCDPCNRRKALRSVGVLKRQCSRKRRPRQCGSNPKRGNVLVKVLHRSRRQPSALEKPHGPRLSPIMARSVDLGWENSDTKLRVTQQPPRPRPQ